MSQKTKHLPQFPFLLNSNSRLKLCYSKILDLTVVLVYQILPEVIFCVTWLGMGPCRLSRLNHLLVAVYLRMVSRRVWGCLPSFFILVSTQKIVLDTMFSVTNSVHVTTSTSNLSTRLISSSFIFSKHSLVEDIFLKESSSLRDWMERGRHYLEEIQLKVIFRKETTTDKIKDLCVLILPIIILMDKDKNFYIDI